MSAALLDATITYLRSRFAPAEVTTLQPYGGEFSGEEFDQLSYSCPAVLVTVLGWAPAPAGARMAGRHVRQVTMAAFVATKHATRPGRLQAAMTLAERVGITLYDWRPDNAGPFALGPLDAEPRCENLYGRAIDKAGQALWLLRWTQCVAPTVPTAALVDLLAIDIEDHTRRGEPLPDVPENPAPLVVSEDVQFVPDN